MATKSKESIASALFDMGACAESREWASGYTSRRKAWAECKRGDWMLWLLGKYAGPSESDGRKKLILCCCDCAELALPYTKNERVKGCIDTARAWANGKATIEELKEARLAAAAYAAADAAAYAAAYAAADAAAYAAYAADAADAAYAAYAAYAADAADAAYAAAYAYAADARSNTLAVCADIVRKHYPKPPKGKVNG